MRVIGALVGKRHATIQKTVNKYKSIGAIENNPRSGRPRIFNDTETHIIVRRIKENAKIGRSKLKCEIENEMAKQCNAHTFRYKIGHRIPLL